MLFLWKLENKNKKDHEIANTILFVYFTQYDYFLYYFAI